MIKTFSRNFNTNLNQIKFSLTKDNKSNKKFIDNIHELDNNKGRMSHNNYFRLKIIFLQLITLKNLNLI